MGVRKLKSTFWSKKSVQETEANNKIKDETNSNGSKSDEMFANSEDEEEEFPCQDLINSFSTLSSPSTKASPLVYMNKVEKFDLIPKSSKKIEMIQEEPENSPNLSYIQQNMRKAEIRNIEAEILKNKASEQEIDDPVKFIAKNLPELLLKYDHVEDLFDWQKDFTRKYISSSENMVCFLPTGGGKTLVSQLGLLHEILLKKSNVLLILPYIALAKEKMRKFTPYALEYNFLIEEYAGGKGSIPPMRRRKQKSLYVATIEKGSALVQSLIEAQRINEIGLIIIDEFHFIGEKGDRGALIEETLIFIQKFNPNCRILALSATLDNLDSLKIFLSATIYNQNFRPVELDQFVIYEDKCIKLEDFKDKENLEQFLFKKSTKFVKGSKVKQNSWMHLVNTNSEQSLIFCPTKKNCENVAKTLMVQLKKNNFASKLNDLEIGTQLISKEIVNLASTGFGFHHSSLTQDERNFIEDSFLSNQIHTLCCTSTLAAGINLPASKVIIRSPFVGRNFISFAQYSQMCGRAGRSGMVKRGESYMVLSSKDEVEKFTQIIFNPESICNSQILEGDTIIKIVLDSLCLSICKSYIDLIELLSCSLAAFQLKNEKMIHDQIFKALQILYKQKLITCHEDNNNNAETSNNPLFQSLETLQNSPCANLLIKPTQLGKAVQKSHLSPLQVTELLEDLNLSMSSFNMLSTFHIIYTIAPWDAQISFSLQNLIEMH